MGKHEKAVEQHTDALKMYKEIYGYDKPHPNIAMCMLNLGAAWSSLGDRKKSIECFSQALEQNRELFGKKSNHSRIATCLTHLGQSLCAAGESEKGLSHLEEALRINRSRVTSDAEVSGCHILRALINLGNAAYEMKRYAKSIEYLEEALEIQKQFARNEADNSAIAETLKKIANAYKSQGEREKSFLYEKRERDVRSKLKNKHGTPAKSIIVHRVSRK
ncbi:uncharacterized protein [Ptychodera flava]|uniref:uncharacterized protein n=1 Tax=Ptychodera flava TaxID=63121 RepID=UPI003969F2EB